MQIMEDSTAANIIRSLGLGPGALPSNESSVSTWNRLFFWWWYALKWATTSSPREKSQSEKNNDLLTLDLERKEYQRHFSDMWNDANLDIMICPGILSIRSF
jgi:hypothetical protein